MQSGQARQHWPKRVWNAHAKDTPSVGIMERCFNQSLLFGISHVGNFSAQEVSTARISKLKTQSAGSPKPYSFTDTHILRLISNLSRHEDKKQKTKKRLSWGDYELIWIKPLGKIFKWLTKLKFLTRPGQPVVPSVFCVQIQFIWLFIISPALDFFPPSNNLYLTAPEWNISSVTLKPVGCLRPNGAWKIRSWMKILYFFSHCSLSHSVFHQFLAGTAE